MKRVEELCISPWPWDYQPNHPDGCRVATAYNCDVSTAEPANARLIAAAPELYECLREAVVESCIAYCGEHPNVCRKKDGECFVQKWRAALAEASGEEAK